MEGLKEIDDLQVKEYLKKRENQIYHKLYNRITHRNSLFLTTNGLSFVFYENAIRQVTKKHRLTRLEYTVLATAYTYSTFNKGIAFTTKTLKKLLHMLSIQDIYKAIKKFENKGLIKGSWRINKSRSYYMTEAGRSLIYSYIHFFSENIHRYEKLFTDQTTNY